ncbi:D-alanyl-D-alanine carboxypeptidase family protein [Acuticoccus sp.]|uniref:D-alanyl-D-alanine carboxypeptidase family protein n=1 Tax=Acuticoccus sp. TaxID=1904378 RepID=UPI003B520A51
MRRWLLAAAAALVAGCSSAPPVEQAAPIGLQEPIGAAAAPIETPAVTPRAYAAVVIDGRSGRVLHEANGSSLRYPASLTKMMTLYLLFEELDAGRLSRGSSLAVSEEAASRPSARLGLKAGSRITADTAARALAVRSANDVAVVVAEELAGSEEAFARRMTQKARALGMSRTTFVNASGLPDPRQVTTARDMAVLGRALSDDFPSWYTYFATRSLTHNGRTWTNTNRLLAQLDGVDGIKTGYIRASGYNLVASVRRGGKHVIAVVIGGRSGAARNARMTELVETYLPKASRRGRFGF